MQRQSTAAGKSEEMREEVLPAAVPPAANATTTSTIKLHGEAT